MVGRGEELASTLFICVFVSRAWEVVVDINGDDEIVEDDAAADALCIGRRVASTHGVRYTHSVEQTAVCNGFL